MIVVIDYDTGNVRNVKNALDYLGVENTLSADPQTILSASGIILPGVGAFAKAMDALKERNLIDVIKQAAKNGIPILGICLGMQLLFDYSLEFGKTKGLSLIDGSVVQIPNDVGVKVPHMGWDKNEVVSDDPMGMPFANQFTYFVHSFYVKTAQANVIAKVDYGVEIPSIVRKNNVIGVQFHPEKSGRIGLAGLEKFKELILDADYSRD